MPKIHVLPKHIADLIAAGEVVDRPSSVVKEAVENSIDAGAGVITVEIKRGGITYIRITDNGCGIEKEDIRSAFLSHATSKVCTSEDLYAIGTLGFRGEALASISAVSKVEVLTKTESSETGVRYCMEGGEETELDDAGCPGGTTIVIRDLFYNTPARMKFLKKDVSEANAVAAVVDRIALSHPEISFRFIRDGKQTLLTPGDGKLLSAVYAVFGKDFANSLIDVHYEMQDVKISGYISKPVFSRPNRNMQFFYINGRLVKTRTGFAALEEAYKGSIMTGKFPSCVLNLEVPAHSVDVNVHPSKLEVRFANEKRIFDCIYYAAKNALHDKDTRVQVDLSKIASQPKFTEPRRTEQMTIQPQADHEIQAPRKPVPAIPKPPQSSRAKTFASPVPFYGDEPAQMPKPIPGAPKVAVCELKKEAKPEIAEETMPAAEEAMPVAEEKIEDFKIVGEAFKTYIFVESQGKLLIVDKHAAHERILYEKLKQSSDSADERQLLLSPVPVTLSKEEYSAVLENLETLAKAGYTVEDFGPGTVIVQECPLLLEQEDITEIIQEIAGYLVSHRNDITTEKEDWIFHSSACRSAIKAGDITSPYELEKFIARLLGNPDIRYCPHGRPVLVEMPKRELEKFFGRV